MIPIAYTDGGRGTASVETGKRGGSVVVLRRGWPVAAEIVGAFPADRDMFALLDVAEPATVARALEVAR